MSLTFDSLASTDNGDSTYDVVLTFTITKNGVPYIDSDGVPGTSRGLPNLDQKTFYAVEYDATTMTFDNSKSFDLETITLVDDHTGQYTITAEGASYAPESSNAQVYGYVADDAIHVDTAPGSHVHLYDFVSSDALTFGTATTTPYESPANVSGCEKCHGKPYMKHGYRQAEVEGLGDFASCKVCHYDTRTGNHVDWQMLVDDPARYADVYFDVEPVTADEKTYYAYKAKIMNDVHMSHAMEFPYPQRMSNCVTCHEGKLDDIFEDANFNAETCRSCHPVGAEAEEDDNSVGHSLWSIWRNAGVEGLHSADADCTQCHKPSGAAEDVLMADLHHGGYEPRIYSSNGTRYSDAIVVTIDPNDDATDFDGDTQELTTDITVTEAIDIPELDPGDVVLDVRAALYPYESKDFYAYKSCDETDNGGGSWSASCDLSGWAADIDSGKLRRVEIVVRPEAVAEIVGDEDGDFGAACDPECGHGEYCADGTCVPEDDIYAAPTAPSRTYELDTPDFSDGYYPEIVDVDKCDVCHDALATTFHSPNRSGNIVVCRMCHNPTSGGSHLEMQSRSLDSYVHAIHSFQPFDLDEVDYADPVQVMYTEMHTEHRFPRFTIKNCEACHNPGMYEVPDQTLTMPAVLSGSWNPADWEDAGLEPPDRDIKNVPSVVVGPGQRACGACHRTHFINEDEFSTLLSFNQHTGLNGYRSDDDWDTVLDSVMWWFGEVDTLAEGPVVNPENCAVCHRDQGIEHESVYDDYIDPQ